MSFEQKPEVMVKTLAEQITTLEGRLADRNKLRDGFTDELSKLVLEVQGRYATRDEQEKMQELKLSIAQLDHGLGQFDQIHPSLTPFLNQPGIRDIERRLRQLRKELESWQAKVGINPDEPVRCRLKMLAAHYHDGKPLKVGDEVVLSRRQLEAWSDRFELVS